MKINNKHIIEGYPNYEKINWPKNIALFQNDLPDTIIIHYTAGASAESLAYYLSRDDIKASAHIVISKNGSIIQLFTFNTIAWHAGISLYGNRSGFNKYSIGIELDDPGLLNKTGNIYRTWFNREINSDNVLHATHRNERNPRY